MDVLMDGWIDVLVGCMVGLVGCMVGWFCWIDGVMVGCMDVWMDVLVDGWID